MSVLTPYLTFAGNCEDALKFYATALNGNIKSLQRFGEAPINADEAHRHRVMHAEFEFAGNTFMASDTMPETPLHQGNNISMTIGLQNEQMATQYFDNLSREGTVEMPLQDTFWGAKFGMLTDKFGIHWMINCELPKQS